MGRCIYKVPTQIRDVKPDAYTPRKVFIGPLHSSVSLNAWNHHNNEFKSIEDTKVRYYEDFFNRISRNTDTIITEMEQTIQGELTNIKASYADAASIDWMGDYGLVNLILRDSVFIMEFNIKLHEARSVYTPKIEESSSLDLIVHHPIYTSTVIADLILLENQLPYFILDRLFTPHLPTFGIHVTLERLILETFSLHTKIRKTTKFEHFTDMFRCAYEESLDQAPQLDNLNGPAILEMNNVGSLSRVGVEFKVQDGIPRSWDQPPLDCLPVSIRKQVDDYSLHMSFDRGCLVMPSFHLDDNSERILRNVIAYEQCHITTNRFTSQYIHFVNFLITNDRDVEVLTTGGVIMPGMSSRLVVDMVNKLNRGLTPPNNSQYHNLAINLQAHYRSRRKRYLAILKRVYFSDLWTGTATVAAILLLFFTLVGTVASVVQAIKAK